MHKVDEGVYRGAQPVTIADFQALKDAGIKFTLDLESGSRWFADGDPLSESRFADIFGIRTYSHPLGEILPPTDDELDLAVIHIRDHQPIYVHCKYGKDRTGKVIKRYRTKVQNWTDLAAKDEMLAFGFHWWYRILWGTK